MGTSSRRTLFQFAGGGTSSRRTLFQFAGGGYVLKKDTVLVCRLGVHPQEGHCSSLPVRGTSSRRTLF